MLNRRSLFSTGALASAAAPFLSRIAAAEASRPTLVFVGHEL
jgi:hypothetical protein